VAEDWNASIIKEFRENDGKVGGRFKGAPILLLHSYGAKTGQERVNPMMYQSVDDGWAVFASKGGAPTNPDWYYNLVANPEGAIEVGTETIKVKGRVVDGTEREAIWSKQKADYPNFAEYERNTTREIPVIVLERA
jgi:deazaflavin-dependent oxidoreductase (nitroreductase family)